MHRKEFVIKKREKERKGKKTMTNTKAKAKANKEIVIPAIKLKKATITLIGESDLVLNKMNKRNEAALIERNTDKAKDIKSPNMWEDAITAIHWRDGLPRDLEYTEDEMKDLLTNNAPCISAFGLKKSFCQAVVRNEIDTYSTKFDACVNVVAPGNLIPINFAEHYIDEKLMSPKKGSPVLVYLNRFTGWSAEVTVQYIDGGAYGLEQIMQVIRLAGFGIGIGSGRTSGYGRYTITKVEG